jgi:hypothetical protein
VNEFACDDGSGSIVVANRHTVDLDDLRVGEVIGTWTVRSGEVDGTVITGSGDVIREDRVEASLTGFLSTD